MTSTFFIVNDASYGNERAHNTLRLASTRATREGRSAQFFLMADAVGCAKTGRLSAALRRRRSAA